MLKPREGLPARCHRQDGPISCEPMEKDSGAQVSHLFFLSFFFFSFFCSFVVVFLLDFFFCITVINCPLSDLSPLVLLLNLHNLQKRY